MIKNIKFPIQILIAIWVVFLINYITPFDLNKLGLLPRTQSGLLGIFTAPFLHGDLGHIISNSMPLFVLLMVTAVTYGSKVYIISFLTVLFGGSMVWAFARTAYHVGASGLIYGLVGFLMFSGIFQRKALTIIVSIGIGLTYGTTMWMGMLPTQPNSISWEGHLFGAIGGIITSKIMGQKGTQNEKT